LFNTHSDDPMAPVSPPSSPSVVHYRFAFEIAGSKNQSTIYPGDPGFRIRGRWSNKNAAGLIFNPETGMSRMPDMPGLVFTVVTDLRIIRRSDPLADPRNERVLKMASRIWQHATNTQTPFTPEKTRTWRNLSDDELKTFCWWALSIKDMKMAVMVGDTDMPNFEEIKAMPGMVIASNYEGNNSQRRRIANTDLVYRDPNEDVEDSFYKTESLDIPDPVVSGDSELMGYESEDQDEYETDKI
jgi:hypothetical protein